VALQHKVATRTGTTLVGLLLMLVALSQIHLTVESVAWRDSNGQAGTSTELPLAKELRGAVDIDLQFNKPLLAGNELHLVPDERLLSLTVNNTPIDLTGIAASRLKNWQRGLNINLDDTLHTGSNTLHARIENNSGNGGIAIEPALGVQLSLAYALLFIGAALVFHIMSTTLRVRAPLRWIGIFSLAWVVSYWAQTPYATRQFDLFEGGGHLDYLRYLLTHMALPPAHGGWEYHQPPAYYLTAMWFYRLGEYLPWLGWQNLLRLCSLLYWMVFLSAGLAIVQHLLAHNAKQQCYAAFAFCCWPAGFIHSIRTGNDVALYAWYTLGLLATCRWWQSGDRRHFGWAGIYCVLAMLSKANGLALVATLGALLAIRTWRSLASQRSSPEPDTQWLLVTYALTVMLAVGVSFAPKLIAQWHGNGNDWLLGGVANSINQRLRVANDWPHLLGFDFTTYIQHPWMSSWDDQAGRQYFWNYLLRSAISSEFSFRDAIVPMALACGILLLLTIVRVLVRVVVMAHHAWLHRSVTLCRRLWKILPVLISGMALLVLLAAYRHKAPYAPNTDFRYIYPALLTLLVLDGALASRYRSTLGNIPLSVFIGGLGVAWIALL
jgi:hypothetical protein